MSTNTFIKTRSNSVQLVTETREPATIEDLDHAARERMMAEAGIEE